MPTPNQKHPLNPELWVREILRTALVLPFIASVFIYVLWYHHIPGSSGILLLAASLIGAYMALNIGANDVANNVGPAVGSKAMTLTGAILIAAIFEASGSIIAGGDVVSTIKGGIINQSMTKNRDSFIWLMMAALLAGAIWLNIATALRAPVSTTHSIIGGILGAGIAAGGFGIANWNQVLSIVVSWIISPVLGGLIAAAILYFIERTIINRTDMLTAAKKIVPLLLSFMTWSFSTYLILKGLNKIWEVDFLTASGIGIIIGIITFAILKPLLHRKALTMPNHDDSINSLFSIPLIFSAALLSFAHGANDVANAVGPLAAIHEALLQSSISRQAHVPMWIMLIGAAGISLGLALYGPRLIRTVGSEITELNKTRAFCIAMAASVTVIIASQFGLPVSSTHIAVGGVFGVGFLREYLKASYETLLAEIMHHHETDHPETIETYLKQYREASLDDMKIMLKELKANSESKPFTKEDRKRLKKYYKEELVRRSQLLKIGAAWIITVPLSGLMAAFLYFTIRGIMVP